MTHIRDNVYHDTTLCGISIDEQSAEPDLIEDYPDDDDICIECAYEQESR